MSREKQIEEMAKELCGMNTACKDCRLDKLCLARNSADILYNAGYRKEQKIPYGCQQCSYKQSDNVIELPCKVGDKIYQADETRIYESTINEITLYTHKTLFVTENVAFDETAIGKGIFLTQKEAEAKMKGGAE